MDQVLKRINLNNNALSLDQILEKLKVSWNWVWKAFCAVANAMFVRSEIDERIEQNKEHVRRLMMGMY